MVVLTKAQIIEMLKNDKHDSMLESNLFCLKMVNACGNDFECDNSVKNGMLNRGELVEAVIKYILGYSTKKAQAYSIDLEELNIEIKYSTRASYASNCAPKTKQVLLVTPKQIVLINKEQMILNNKGRVSPNYNGMSINSEIVKKINKLLTL